MACYLSWLNTLERDVKENQLGITNGFVPPQEKSRSQKLSCRNDSATNNVTLVVLLGDKQKKHLHNQDGIRGSTTYKQL